MVAATTWAVDRQTSPVIRELMMAIHTNLLLDGQNTSAIIALSHVV